VVALGGENVPRRTEQLGTPGAPGQPYAALPGGGGWARDLGHPTHPTGESLKIRVTENTGDVRVSVS
jgi:hypothetical protein